MSYYTYCFTFLPSLRLLQQLHTLFPDLELGASKTKKQGQWRIHFGGGSNNGGSNGSHIRILGQRWMHPLSNATGVVTQAVASGVHWKQEECHIEVWFLAAWSVSANVWARLQPSWRHFVGGYPKIVSWNLFPFKSSRVWFIFQRKGVWEMVVEVVSSRCASLMYPWPAHLLDTSFLIRFR